MTQSYIPTFFCVKETSQNFLYSSYFNRSFKKRRKAFNVSGHIVDKVQKARAEDECPSPDCTMEDSSTSSVHHWVLWFTAQALVSYPSSRVLEQ